jgi:hypothetical protein
MSLPRFIKQLSRLKFSTRGRLIRAIAAGGLGGLYLKAEADIEMQDEIKYLTQIEDIKNKNCDKDEAILRKHTNLLIQQAFKDSGFKGNVYTRIRSPYEDSPFNAGAIGFTVNVR